LLSPVFFAVALYSRSQIIGKFRTGKDVVKRRKLTSMQKVEMRIYVFALLIVEALSFIGLVINMTEIKSLALLYTWWVGITSFVLVSLTLTDGRRYLIDRRNSSRTTRIFGNLALIEGTLSLVKILIWNYVSR
jgi:hypothetical protein